ncbi:hypothetical protein SAMD00019534_120660 [Acytostelium subglobosum LB1]|uniref:hypothetical protein n=1 Tax=Acytostelium subglobosum LB1 TaxID=1410327 RepID=UPI000644AAD7|nr:hypothetical protein SAMD00019534_120660 [Acytostelium subglobosum LB1]GAM28890.1 hypothetical protein SAMD00019534_120660 [Acytostelium subglobosum LB1]|eukprot:XP_012748075.1 hypothetical protein SAMD00019534_120660 [Acytostelium subglobosum LB1]
MITDLCVLNVTGPAIVNAPNGAIFKTLEIIFNPANGTSTLNWSGDVQSTNLNLTSIGGELPKMRYHSSKVEFANSTGSPIIGYLETNSIASLKLPPFTINTMVINKALNLLSLPYTIGELFVNQSSVANFLAGTSLRSVSLVQSSKCTVNTPISIDSLVSTSSTMNITNAAVSIGSISHLSSPLNILVGAVASVGAGLLNNSLLTVEAGGSLAYTGGVLGGALSVALNGQASFSGPVTSILNTPLTLLGTMSLNAGASIIGSQSIKQLVQSTGVLSINNASSLNTTTLVVQEGGAVNLNGGSILNAPLSLLGQLVSGIGSLISGSSVNITGSLSLNGGSIVSSPLDLQGSLSSYFGSSITSSYVTAHNNSSLSLGGDVHLSTLDIKQGAKGSVRTGGALLNSILSLSGKLVVEAGSSVTTSALTVQSSALLSVTGGTLIGSPLTSTGKVMLDNGSTITGATLSLLIGGQLNITANSKVNSVDLKLDGITHILGQSSIVSSDLTLTGNMSINEGSMITQSQVDINNGALMNMILGRLLNTPVAVQVGAKLSLDTATITDSPLTVLGVVYSKTNVSISSSSTKSPVSITGNGLLSVSGSLYATSTLSVSALIDGGGQLALANNALFTAGDMAIGLYRINAQISSKGGVLQSVGTIQLANQHSGSISDISILSSSLDIDTDKLVLNNSLLTVHQTLSSTMLNGSLSMIHSTLGLTTESADISLRSVSLSLENVRLHLASFLPARLVISDNTSTINVANLTVVTSGSVPSDATYTIGYSAASSESIQCNNNNGSQTSSSPSYQFICDGSMIVLRFINCSSNSKGECPMANGTCPLDRPVQCLDDTCVTSIYDCLALPPCPSLSQRCADGKCVTATEQCSNVTSVAAKFFGCPIGYFQCPSGHCQRNVSDCCVNCLTIATNTYPMQTTSPFDSSKDVIIPILSKDFTLGSSANIYGYVSLPLKFTNTPMLDYISINALDDSYLDTINGTDLWGPNQNYRDHIHTMVYNVTLGNIPNPLFDTPVQFKFKSSGTLLGLNFTITKLAFINVTSNRWQAMDSIVLCEEDNTLICASTNHFTSFAVLTDYNGGDGKTGGESANAQSGALSRTTLIVVTTSVVGGIVAVSAVGAFLFAKVTKHGSLKYWWASKPRTLPSSGV